MTEERKQTEIIELEVKVSSPSQETYDLLQKLGHVKQGMAETGKATAGAAESMEMLSSRGFGSLKAQAIDIASVFGITLPRAIGLGTLAMAAIDTSKQITNMRNWERAVAGTTTATEEWARQQRYRVLEVAWQWNLLPEEVQKTTLALGKARVPENLLSGAFDATRLAMTEFQVDVETASNMAAYALTYQQKPLRALNEEIVKYSLLAKEAGVSGYGWVDVMLNLQRAMPETSKALRGESMLAFIKEFKSLGPGMATSIIGAPPQQQALWGEMFHLSPTQIKETPEKVAIAAMKEAERVGRGYPAGTVRQMAMFSVLQKILGMDDESVKALIEDIDKGIPFEKVAEAIVKKSPEMAERAKGRMDERMARAKRPPEEAMARGGQVAAMAGYGAGLVAGGNQPLTQEDGIEALSLVQGMTPEQRRTWARTLYSTYAPMGLGIPINGLQGLSEKQLMPTNLDQMEWLRKIASGALRTKETPADVSSLIPSQLGIPTHPSSIGPTQPLSGQLKVVIELQGQAAHGTEIRDVQMIPSPYNPLLNVGVEIMRRRTLGGGR